MSQPTPEQVRAEFVNTLAREVENAKRDLKAVISRANEALAAFDKVERPGRSISPTVFGQDAVDADARIARVLVLLELGNSQGLTTEDVEAAFSSDYQYRYVR